MAVVRARQRSPGPAPPPRPHRRRLDLRRQAGHRRRSAGRRRDDRDHEGRDQAEPRADAARGSRRSCTPGPFGNIAHAANSILADRIALKLADYVVTEAGFASDLGFQKFCDIVCRTARITPSAAVLVTTVRATKSHGGKAFKDLGKEDLDAIRRGADNLAAHVQIVRSYGLPCVVTINGFPTDTPKEIALVRELALKAGAETVVVHDGFAKGGEGAVDLAKAVVDGVRQAEHVLVPDARRHAARAADRGDRDEDLRRGRHRPADAGA